MMVGAAGATLLKMQGTDFELPSFELPISKSIHTLFFFVSTSTFIASRWIIHWAFRYYKQPKNNGTRAVLIGADLELMLFAHLNDISRGFKIVAILDNNPFKHGMRIYDARVVGGLSILKDVIHEYSVDTVLLLKDSMELAEITQVEQECSENRIKLVRLGSLQESLLRSDSLSTADLLERQEYRFLPKSHENYLYDRRVLVTGAGGSIGSELVRQILRCEPRQVILLGRGENSIFELERELQSAGLLEKTKSVIVNVADEQGLERVFNAEKPEIVFHAAAHKHVPLMEANVREAILNNVFGTLHVMELSAKVHAERVVMISTDKAVSPRSVMGATKAKAEGIVSNCSRRYPKTKYSIVRFGNVLGSRGSVVRLFMEQIRKGGPVTVTDPRMTRYFMTIPEAVSLVLATGTLGSQSMGIFVLKMGAPYRIVELAERMIRLCGLEPGRDIQIQFTGVRPGEKIDEVLNETHESLVATSNAQINQIEGHELCYEMDLPDLNQSDLMLKDWLGITD